MYLFRIPKIEIVGLFYQLEYAVSDSANEKWFTGLGPVGYT